MTWHGGLKRVAVRSRRARRRLVTAYANSPLAPAVLRLLHLMGRKKRLIGALALSLAAALLVFAASYEFREISGFSSAVDQSLDEMLALQADQAEHPATSIPIVLIDFDDAAFARQGWPPLVPRDMLSRILQLAVRSGAKLVVVDVDIGWADSGSDGAAIGAALAFSESRRVPTVLVRDAYPAGDQLRVVRPTAYDAFVAHSHYVRYSSFPIVREEDGVARRVLPWSTVCASGAAMMLPAAHTLGGVALAGDKSAPFQSADQIFNVGLGACDRFDPRQVAPPEPRLRTPAGLQDFAIDDAAIRILFRISWDLPAGVVRPTLPSTQGMPHPSFIRLSADDLSAVSDNRTAAILQNAIVVVGSSAVVSGDSHATPLGRMPGVGILANALGQVTIAGGSAHVPWYLRWALVAPPIVVGMVFTTVSTMLTWLVFFLGHRLTRNHVLVDEGLRLAIEGLWVVLAWILVGSSVVVDIALPQLVVTSVLFTLTGLAAP